ncbi:MAG: WYL domain-containing protein, partial [Myxococcota bacterium]
FHDSIRSALTKIRAGLGPELSSYLERLSDGFRVLPGPHKRYEAFRDTIRALNQGVLEKDTLEMRYRTARTGEEATRRIDPYKVWYHLGALYVLGLDHRSGEIRTFSIDRIQAIETTGEAFEVPEDFDFDAYTSSGFGVVADPAVPVRIRFTADWATYIDERQWHASQSTQRLPDGRLELAMEVGATQELANWLLSFGGGAEVLAPAYLRKEVLDSLKEALAHYS